MRAAVSTSRQSAVGACGSPPVYVIAVWSEGVDDTATTVSAMFIVGWSAPQVPMRSSRVAPSWISSSKTIAALGQPMPVACTEIGRPSNVPVKPSIPRSSLTRTGSSKNVRATYSARFGSPGHSTAGAYEPGSARRWIGMGGERTRRSVRRPICGTQA